MDPNPDPGMCWNPQEPAGPSEETVRRLYDEYVNLINTHLTEYEGAVSASDTRLKALEKQISILPDTGIVPESIQERLVESEARLPTNAKRVK